ncbi:MAG: VOC family protein [Alphaproteobacteria bacterium]|nr:VOC family protein [Alphaproteobacteria bacterium]
MKNTFGWMQMGASDPKKAKEFYGHLFHWTMTEQHKKADGEMSYIEIDAGEGPCAGIAQGENKNVSQWIPFVNVTDIHEYTAKAEKLGAKIIVPITDLGGDEGFYSVFIDPTGAVLGLYAPR